VEGFASKGSCRLTCELPGGGSVQRVDVGGETEATDKSSLVSKRWPEDASHPIELYLRNKQDPSTILGPNGLDGFDPPDTGQRYVGDELVNVVRDVDIDVAQRRNPCSFSILVLTLVEIVLRIVFVLLGRHWKEVSMEQGRREARRGFGH